MEFEDLYSMVPADLQPFVLKTHQQILQLGYVCEVKEAKSGPVVSYKKRQKVLFNYVCRQSGIKARVYANHIDNYAVLPDTFPETMKQESRKATDCKMFAGKPCFPNCPGGYAFRLDGQSYGKCRNMAFLYSLTPESAPFIWQMIDSEAQSRDQ